MKAVAFRGQVAVVTGASSGIGRALALNLARQGARVVLAARRADLLEQAADECRQAGGEALAVPTDVSDELQCKAMVEKAVARFGGVDLLVNNAGLTVIAPLQDYPNLDLFKHTLAVNFYGAVYCTYHALSHLIKSEGRIVAVSSLGGKMPVPWNTAYAASKYALHGFFDSLRIELQPHGVSVTVICPGMVVTGFHEAQMDKDGTPQGPRGRNIYSRDMMSSDRSADILVWAAWKRKREVVMGHGPLLLGLRLVAPALVDRLVVAFLKVGARRIRQVPPPIDGPASWWHFSRATVRRGQKNPPARHLSRIWANKILTGKVGLFLNKH